MWTDDTELQPVHLDLAPDGPGILVLVHGGAGAFEQLIWAELCANLRTRVSALLTEPQTDDPLLARILRMHDLRFRTALTMDPEIGATAMARLRETLAGMCRCGTPRVAVSEDRTQAAE